MSNDYGDQISASDIAPYAIAAYGGYKAYNRLSPFLQGSIDATQGAGLGSLAARGATQAVTGTVGPTVRAAVGGLGRAAVGRAAVGMGLRVGAGAAASAASGAAAGASAGSVVPGLGTLVGAAAGAIAPLIIPHTPLAGVINRIPLIGGILSPKQKKTKVIPGGSVAVRQQNQDPHFMSSPKDSQVTPWEQTTSARDYAMSSRAEYNAGRGFRRA